MEGDRFKTVTLLASQSDENIIRVNIPHEELLSVKNSLDVTNDDEFDLIFENGLTAKVFWD